MKSITALVRPLGIASLVFLGQPLVYSQPANTPPADAYATAVQGYIDSASNEIAALRDQVVATEKSGNKDKASAARTELKNCEALLNELKSAGPSKFDPVKLRYEKARSELIQKLAEARQP